MGEEDVDLRDSLEELIASGKINVILNLQDVRHIDSTGLGTLAITQARLRQGGGHMVLLNVCRTQMQLLVQLKLEAVLEVFNDEQDAVNSFIPGRAAPRFDILSFVQSAKQTA